MLLALDIGNTQMFGGLINDGAVIFSFRRASKSGSSSDEIGIFLRAVLRENGIDPQVVEKIAICSVVPSDNHSLSRACQKYFSISPFFIDAMIETGFTNLVDTPCEVGADRIANAIAACKLFAPQDMIIIDLGTATTFCAINSKNQYLGGAILAGLKLQNEALGARAAKLSNVEIRHVENALGKNTTSQMQSGLYFAHLGAMRELIARISKECFAQTRPKIIATGGFANIFNNADIFDEIVPNLALIGLDEAVRLNPNYFNTPLSA